MQVYIHRKQKSEDDQNRLKRFMYSTKDYRLRTIHHFEGSDVYNIFRTDNIIWGKPGSPNDSNLITRTVGEGRGKIHFAENYQYDLNGNPIRKEYRFLRATSLAESPISLQNDRATGGEVKVVETQYNDSNLPTLIYDGRLHTELTYVPSPSNAFKSEKEQTFSSTPLVKRRLQKDGNTILKREFYDYDHTVGATSYIADDGCSMDLNDLSGVHQRLINRCINKNGLFAGLPLVVTSSGWDCDKQQEQLIQKTEFEYDDHGHITLERHYDSEDNLAYTLNKIHDIQGNALYETDPLGQPTSRTFDKYRCLLKEQGPSQSFYTEYAYDYLQRPIRCTQVYADGLRLSTQTAYNLQGNPTKEVGIYGQTTAKQYNNQYRLDTLIEPPVRVGYGEWRSPQTNYTYDLIGSITSETTLNGAQTIYQNSTFGKPLSIQYPDGRIEYFKYSIFGELIEKTDPNGTKTIYTYDSLGRVLTENTFDTQSALLKSHKFTYEGSNLVKEEDGALTTTYAYDHAGRIIRKCQGNNCVEYSYDGLGRLIEEKVYYGNDPDEYIATKKSYDLLNRVIEEQTTDATGKIHFWSAQTYDELDHVTSISVKTHAGVATTLKKYDLQGNLSSETDPLGNTTHYVYRYDYYFEGQNLPYVEIIDPVGVKKETISDYQGRMVNEKIYSPFGELLSEIDMIYDLFGNVIRKDHRMPTKTITTSYEYDLCQRLICQIDGAGTQEKLTTTFIYNAVGELAQTIYSDGTSKNRRYDSLGRLHEEWACDDSIHYRYTYNQNDLPVIIENLTSGKKTVREYSQEGNLLSEQFENGLTVEYNYDRMNRIVEYFCPDGSSIRKTYNPVFLEKTERIKNGQVAYEACFEEFDLKGNPKGIRFPGSSGTLSLEYDLMSRPVALARPHYKEERICYDSRGYLISKIVNKDSNEFNHDFFGQLTLEKSSKYSHSYQNDALNRQIVVDDVEQTHNAVHQLTHGIHGEYVYDQKGRRIQDGSIHYVYDRFDRLEQINCGDETWRYTYDAFNRKMSRSNNGTVSHYIYNGYEEIGSYDTERKSLDMKVLSGNEGSIPIAIEIGQNTYAPIISSQGHIVGLVGIKDSDLVEETPLTMFGCDLNETPYSPWRFCGKRHESVALGIIDFGYRYYHPKSAQWLTRDPLGESEGPNLYSYVRNNPTRCIDRYGLFSLSWGFYSNDSDTSFKSVMKGICHGVIDFAYENNWDLQRGAFYIGCDLSELEYNERLEMTAHFDQTELEQRASFEASVKNLLAVDEFEENHDAIRYGTTTGLAILSVAYGGVKAVQGVYNLGKGLYNGRKAASALTKLTNASKKEFCLDKLSQAGQAMDRGGLTRAGRALDKHGNRPDTVYPKARGTPLEKNLQGQFQLDDILTHPQSYNIENNVGGINYYTPDGRGAFFYADGTFRGFLQP
jgi:RHS repeat-associated protein